MSSNSMSFFTVKMPGECRNCGAHVSPTSVFCERCLTESVDHYYWIGPTEEFMQNAFPYLIANEFTSVDRPYTFEVEYTTSEPPNQLVARYATSFWVVWAHDHGKWCDGLISTEDKDGSDFLRRVTKHDNLTRLGFLMLKSYFRIQGPGLLERLGNLSAVRSKAPSQLARLSSEPEAFFVAEVDGQLRLVAYEQFGYVDYEERNISPGRSIYIARPRLIDDRLRRRLDALDVFESLVSSPKCSEGDLQRFFTENPEFLLILGGEYQRLHPHPHEHGGGHLLVPDFYLEKMSGLIDLVELKHPTAQVVVGSGNIRRFSQSVIGAFAQLRSYRDAIRSTRWGGTGSQQFKACHPTLILVIGRSSGFVDFREKEELLDQFNGVRLFTYDEIAEMMRLRVKH